MGKRERENWTISLEQSGALILLSVLFLIGGVAGCLFSQVLIRVESESLVSYLSDYMTLVQGGQVKTDFWNTAWNECRSFLFVVLLGMTPFKRVGVPLVLFLRGFFLSFSVGCLVQVFGLSGLCLGIVLFLIPAFFWGPALLLAGYRFISLNLPYSREGFWLSAMMCGVFLIVCIGVECWVVPMLLGAVVHAVL